MLGFDKYLENKTLLYSAGAVAFLVAALLILFIFRLAFGRRLHMPGGGRARQPRLGVVDAFDLDRQRQLVLVRRDNVEHLVMIGGPNDVLIESQIVRAEAREMPRVRDKEPTVAPLTVAPASPAPFSWPGGAAPAALPLSPPSVTAEPKLTPEEPVAVRELAKETPLETAPPIAVPPIAAQIKATPAAPPPARPPFLPLPPRRPITTPSFNFKPAPPRPPVGEPAIGPGVDLQPPALKPPGTPNTLNAGPSLSAPSAGPIGPSAPPLRPLRPSPPPSPLAPPVTPAQPIDTAPSAAPAVASPQESEPENVPTTADAIESLEEEMAKLLGRSTKES